MYDEWDDDPDDFLNYRHQRRLSDPSANLNNYSRYGWKTKPSAASNCDQASGNKAMSQNEGLDSLANELSEIEAGDLKDGKFFLTTTYRTLITYCTNFYEKISNIWYLSFFILLVNQIFLLKQLFIFFPFVASRMFRRVNCVLLSNKKL